jgi:hypothetical protein
MPMKCMSMRCTPHGLEPTAQQLRPLSLVFCANAERVHQLAAKSRRSNRKVKEASCIVLCQRPLEPILQKLQMAINLLQQGNHQGPAGRGFTDL